VGDAQGARSSTHVSKDAADADASGCMVLVAPAFPAAVRSRTCIIPRYRPPRPEAIARELAEWSDDLLVDDGYAAALLRVASFALDSYAAGQPRARDRDRDRGLAS
jgi:hypothetical protein